MNDKNFEVAYGLTGQDRKKLVEAISEFLHFAPVYCGAPTFNYVVNNYTINLLSTAGISEDAHTLTNKVGWYLLKTNRLRESFPEYSEKG